MNYILSCGIIVHTYFPRGVLLFWRLWFSRCLHNLWCRKMLTKSRFTEYFASYLAFILSFIHSLPLYPLRKARKLAIQELPYQNKLLFVNKIWPVAVSPWAAESGWHLIVLTNDGNRVKWKRITAQEKKITSDKGCLLRLHLFHIIRYAP